MPTSVQEREAELVRRSQAGDQEAVVLLLEMHKRYIYLHARREGRRNPWADVEDLAMAGRMGFIKALGNFDPRRGNKLLTFCAWWVMREVRVESDRMRPIRVYRDLRFKEQLAAAKRVVSLSLPLSDHGGELTFPEPPAPEPPEPANGPDEIDELREAVARLHPRYRQIFELRWFGERTLEETAALMGITRERVRQLEKAAVLKLRDQLRRCREERDRRAGRERERFYARRGGG